MRYRFFITGLLISIGVLLAVLHPRGLLISAVAPTVDTVTATYNSSGTNVETFTLVEAATTALFVHGQITDADGCDDVTASGTVSGVFFRTNASGGAACTVDNNYCYSLASTSCTLTNCTPPGDNIFNYECTAAIWYYADTTSSGPNSATDWTAKIQARDSTALIGSSTDTIDIATTIALEPTASIAYGTLSLGAESAQAANVVTNTGNTGIDLDVNVLGDLTCTGVGSNIEASQVHYSLASGFNWASGTALSTTAADLEFDLDRRTDDLASSTRGLYFKLQVPGAGIGGVCTNTIRLTGKVDAEGGW